MLETLIENVKNPGSTHATNFVDKLNYQVTVLAFFFLALLSTLNSYVGDPIDCWTPEYFTSQWIKYVDNICWMRNTYYIPQEFSVPQGRDELHIDWELTYYQWVPIILGMLALTFFFPNLLWHSTMKHIININVYVESFLESEHQIDLKARYETMDIAAKNFVHFLEQRKLRIHHLRHYPFSWAKMGLRGLEKHKLTLIYISVKLLYIVIALGDLWLLSLFFGHEFYYFGLTVGEHVYKTAGSEKIVETFFPKITLCDFYIRETGYLKTHTVTCVLTINLFTEKIFLIVWTFLIANVTLTSFNLILWIWRLAIPFNRYRFISKALKRASRRFGVETEILSKHREDVHEFVRDDLGPDGVFMLRMCQINTNKTFSSDFIRWVFHKWMELRAKPNGPKTKDITFGVKIPAGTKRDAPDGGAGGRILSIRKKPAESLQDLAPPSYNLLHPQGNGGSRVGGLHNPPYFGSLNTGSGPLHEQPLMTSQLEKEKRMSSRKSLRDKTKSLEHPRLKNINAQEDRSKMLDKFIGGI